MSGGELELMFSAILTTFYSFEDTRNKGRLWSKQRSLSGIQNIERNKFHRDNDRIDHKLIRDEFA